MGVYRVPEMKGLVFTELPGARYLISLGTPPGGLVWVEMYADSNTTTGRRGRVPHSDDPEEIRKIVVDDYQTPPVPV